MLYNILGLIFIILAIWGGIFTLNNKNNMPLSVYGLQKEKYEVIDKNKFNSIMVTQSIFLSIYISLTGILCMLSKQPACIILPAFTIYINIIFSKKAKKYIKQNRTLLRSRK